MVVLWSCWHVGRMGCTSSRVTHDVVRGVDVEPLRTTVAVVTEAGQARLALLRSEWPHFKLKPLSEEQVKGLALLYLKGCKAGVSAATRTEAFRLALGKTRAHHSKKERDAATAMWERLEHLVKTPKDQVVAADAEAAGWQTWAEFCALPGMDAWTSPGARVLFDQFRGSLVQRRQLWGSCFEQAPVVMAHYAICFNAAAAFPPTAIAPTPAPASPPFPGTPAAPSAPSAPAAPAAPAAPGVPAALSASGSATPDGLPTPATSGSVSPGPCGHDMVDLTAFALSTRTPEELWDFIEKDAGGSSRDALPLLTGLKDGTDIAYFQVLNDSADQLDAVLRDHGPVLMSRVKVTQSLFDTTSQTATRFSLTGIVHPFQMDPTTGVPLHAMTLVGVRTLHDGTKRFLLQNWWIKKQFLEVDCAYLQHCGAEASYITSRGFTAWPASYPTTHGRCVESAFGGKETSGPKERRVVL